MNRLVASIRRHQRKSTLATIALDERYLTSEPFKATRKQLGWLFVGLGGLMAINHFSTAFGAVVFTAWFGLIAGLYYAYLAHSKWYVALIRRDVRQLNRYLERKGML